MCISFRSCSVEKNIAFLQRAWSRRIDKDEKGEEGVLSADQLALQLQREASFPTVMIKMMNKNSRSGHYAANRWEGLHWYSDKHSLTAYPDPVAIHENT